MFKTLLSCKTLFMNCLSTPVYELVKDCYLEIKEDEVASYESISNSDELLEMYHAVTETNFVCVLECSLETFQCIQSNFYILNELEKASYILGCNDLKIVVESTNQEIKKQINHLNQLYGK